MTKSDQGAVLIFIGFVLGFWAGFTNQSEALFIAVCPPLLITGTIRFIEGISEENKKN